jgi:Spy/CpxP family protein refolding chaperone
MRNTRSLRLALAGATLFSGAVLANPPGDMPMHGGMMGGGMGKHMGMGKDSSCGKGGWSGNDHMISMGRLDALKLNADQRKKVADLRRELRKNTWDLQRQEIDHREQLGELYSSDKLDVAAIKATYEKLFQVKLKMIEHTLNFKQSLEKVLTKEQLQQFHQMMHGPMGGAHGSMMMDDSDEQ